MHHWGFAVLVAVFTTACTDPRLLEAPSAPTFATGAGGGTVSALNTPPAGNFRYTPATRAGQAPFAFEVNMCKTLDPDTTDDLRFVVSWGDGTSDRGLCYLRHTYEKPGRYDGRACVSDRVLGSAESCEEFVVDVAGKDEVKDEAPAPALPAIVRTGSLTGLETFTLGADTALFIPLFSEGWIQADLTTARRIVVRLETMTSNTMTDVRFGLSPDVSFAFTDGCPNLAGQTGTLTCDLTPAQFAGIGSFRGFALQFVGPGSIALPASATMTVSIYL